MEATGEFSEHPFQGLSTDIPMNSLSITIEIDLLEFILKEVDVKPVSLQDDVLL